MERKQLREWYRPAERETPEAPDREKQAVAALPPTAREEGPDVFEEAGLFRDEAPVFSPWTPEEKKPKKRRWGSVVGAVLGIAAVVGLIVATSLFFARQEPDGTGNYRTWEGNRVFDLPELFQRERAKEPAMERAPVNKDVQVSLLPLEETERMELRALYEQCVPSVVGIKAGRGIGYAWGSGVIMTADGYILTNAHILEDAAAARVVLYDETEYEARLVGADAISDIAVLKVEALGLTPARFGDSALLSVGDEVVAIGNPLNERFSGTMTPGIISGVSREMTYRGRTMTLLQTDAAINEGNSGGPLFNRYGQVVGITNMKVVTSSSSTPVEGIGFAIPSTTVQSTANAILRDGAVLGRPGLGIYGTEIAADADHPAGVRVAAVTEASDANAQGLRPEDIIVKIDGIDVDSFQALKDRIDSLNVGDTVRLEIWRAGQILEKNITLIDQNQMEAK